MIGVAAPHAQLAADDRLDSRLGGRHGKFERAEEVAGIGHGDGRHGVALGQRDQLLDLDRARRERIGGVRAQVNEIGEAHLDKLGRALDRCK